MLCEWWGSQNYFGEKQAIWDPDAIEREKARPLIPCFSGREGAQVLIDRSKTPPWN